MPKRPLVSGGGPASPLVMRHLLSMGHTATLVKMLWRSAPEGRFECLVTCLETCRAYQPSLVLYYSVT